MQCFPQRHGGVLRDEGEIESLIAEALHGLLEPGVLPVAEGPHEVCHRLGVLLPLEPLPLFSPIGGTILRTLGVAGFFRATPIVENEEGVGSFGVVEFYAQGSSGGPKPRAYDEGLSAIRDQESGIRDGWEGEHVLADLVEVVFQRIIVVPFRGLILLHFLLESGSVRVQVCAEAIVTNEWGVIRV